MGRPRKKGGRIMMQKIKVSGERSRTYLVRDTKQAIEYAKKDMSYLPKLNLKVTTATFVKDEEE